MSFPLKVGRSTPRFDAFQKAEGAPCFGGDQFPHGSLFAGVLRCPHPSAKILGIDPTPARATEGVEAVLTARDIPGHNAHENRFGPDQPVLAEDRVRFRGQAVALAAGRSPEAVEEALKKIQVRYEERPAVFDPAEAMRAEAPRVHESGNIARHWSIRRGDVTEGFRKAARIVENSYRTPFVEHAFLEPEAGAAWVEPDGRITVRLATQQVENHKAVAEVLGVAPDRVRILGTFAGGAFGGKEDPCLEVYLALLAWKTGKAVSLTLSREESFLAHSKKHPFRMRYRTGADAQGRLTALEVEIVADAGAHLYLTPMITLNATLLAQGPYRVPNVSVDTYAVFTHNLPTSTMRGVGITQVTYAMESQMDDLARLLEIDPVDFRCRNFLGAGDEIATGQKMTRALPLEETARRAWAALGPRTPQGRGTGKRIGRGIASNLTGYAKPGRAASAEVSLDARGRAVVRTSATDLGSGQSAVLRQIAGDALGLTEDQVILELPDSALSPSAGITAGSMQLTKAGNAALQAAAEVRGRVLRLAAERLECGEADLVLEGGRVWNRAAPERALSLAEIAASADGKDALRCLASYAFPPGSFDKQGTSEGNGWLDYTPGTHAAEVEVDEATGEVTVLKLAACHDVGRAIHPQMVEGQLEGGGVMGLGYALMEEVILEGGALKTQTFDQYLIPTSLDVPDVAPLLLESGAGIGPHGARGIGEPPCNVPAAAIANAIRDAVGARVTSLPITPEKVLRAVRKD
ncbi:MAG: xanthine dehydrogenase family protein molybdopterin-binding subunit [Candidatus Tectomicrobia bacterium]|nr:xanthine dehydrogenase family protein molybdopterin-binding subunit [Candidatus Tectomicrobia bacterium]